MRTLFTLAGITLGVTVTILTRKYGPPLILHILTTDIRGQRSPT